jgi:hypothetical protein
MPNAGAIIPASDIPVIQYRRKGASETVTSSTIVQDDDDIQIPLAVGAWRVELFGSATGAAGGDLRTQWTFSGTASIARSTFGPGGSTTDVTNGSFSRASSLSFTSPAAYGTDGASASAVYEDLLVEVSAPGSLVLQWAQNVSNATGTALGVSTRIYVTPVQVF